MAKNRNHVNRPTPVGLVRTGATTSACGLCGHVGTMTKSHVPPRSAGNEGFVSAVRLVTRPGGPAQPSRPRHGGMYVYGLCAACNGLASKYDDAYGQIAWTLQPLWPRNPQTELPPTVTLPDFRIRPGAVVRSLLIGMYALNPNLRATHPQLAADLRAGATTRLPGDLRLRVALNRSQRGRISGAIGGVILVGPYATPRINDTAPGIMALASVYFPPLAWVLTTPDRSLLDQHRYADASDWLASDVTQTAPLNRLLPPLPFVHYPQHDPSVGSWWTEMFSDEITEIVEADYLPPSVLRRPED